VTCLAAEAFKGLWMLRVLRAQQLDRHDALQYQVRRPPDLAYATGGDRLIQAVALSKYDTGFRHDAPQAIPAPHTKRVHQ
jgi:hypothetical protein